MPEGPELHLASKFVNNVGKDYIFSGEVEKSAVSTKNPDVDWNEKSYVISAQSRGKEVKLTLMEWRDDDFKTKTDMKPNSVDILFRFGMSGKFTFTKAHERPKHAHLNFFTQKDNMVLSFVDYRRFGRWEVNGDWSKGRGPCVIQEYTAFRNHVLKNVESPVFKKPICEVMLNQAYFNGIGNYLRAEILYRLKIPPFVSAKSVVEKLVIADEAEDKKQIKVKSEQSDFLQLCNTVPLEVVNLDGTGYDPDTGTGDLSDFNLWLRCYYCPDMKNMVDHNGRTIWFWGEAGPLKPKDSKSRGMKTNKRNNKQAKAVKDEMASGDLYDEAPAKKKRGQMVKKTTKSPAVKARKQLPKSPAAKVRKQLLKSPAANSPANGHVTRGKLRKIKENGESSYFSDVPKRRKLSTSKKLAIAAKVPVTPEVKLTPKVPRKHLKQGRTSGVSSPRGVRRSSRVRSQKTS